MTSDPFSILGWAVVVAFTAAGCVQLVRQIPWVITQMFAGRKPWACDLCMSFWSSLLASLFWALAGNVTADVLERGLSAIPAFALTLLITHALGSPTSDFKIEDIPELPEPPEETP